jgi:hypothetical protein
MAKEKYTYQQFFETVEPPDIEAVQQLHALMERHGCGLKIEAAKQGFVVSYLDPKTKKTVANLVFRKNGLHLRLYADHAAQYAELVAALPEKTLAQLDKAPNCKRLMDIAPCSPYCVMGADFELRGTRYQKCRFNAFLMPLAGENFQGLMAMTARELELRVAGHG